MRFRVCPHRSTLRQCMSKTVMLWSVVLLGCLAGIIYLVLQGSSVPPPTPVPPPPLKVKLSSAQFDELIRPQIVLADAANRDSAARAIRRLQETFAKYRAKVPAFTADLTSLNTRWSILTSMPGDWWYADNRIRKSMQAKFEEHLFSEQQLKREIEDALVKFRDEIKANETAMLASIRAAVDRNDLPDFPEVDYGSFSKEVVFALQDYASESGMTSVQRAIVTEFISGVGGAAAESLFVAVLGQLATTTTTAAAAGGGTMATGAAAGGGGGSLAGPGGTAIGLVAGLVVGSLIDWWMTERLEAELNTNMTSMIQQIENSLIDGTEDQPGLRSALPKTCDVLKNAYQITFSKRLTGGFIQ